MNMNEDTIYLAKPRRIIHPVNIKWDAVKQGLRFIVVGVANTAVDFAVLNALIYAFGLDREDSLFIVFKTIAFIVAAVNSFLLNKNWVFEEKILTTGKRLRMQVYKFLSVSTASMIINIAISYAAFALTHRLYPELSTQIIANLSALVGTAAVFISNFFGYKLFVFKK